MYIKYYLQYIQFEFELWKLHMFKESLHLFVLLFHIDKLFPEM